METGRGDAAAATWIFRGDLSRRRRGARRGYSLLFAARRRASGSFCTSSSPPLKPSGTSKYLVQRGRSARWPRRRGGRRPGGRRPADNPSDDGGVAAINWTPEPLQDVDEIRDEMSWRLDPTEAEALVHVVFDHVAVSIGRRADHVEDERVGARPVAHGVDKRRKALQLRVCEKLRVAGFGELDEDTCVTGCVLTVPENGFERGSSPAVPLNAVVSAFVCAPAASFGCLAAHDRSARTRHCRNRAVAGSRAARPPA